MLITVTDMVKKNVKYVMLITVTDMVKKIKICYVDHCNRYGKKKCKICC